MPTPAEVETDRLTFLYGVLTELRKAGYQCSPDQTETGIFAISRDQFGYYITVQSLAITDPMHVRLAELGALPGGEFGGGEQPGAAAPAAEHVRG